MSVSTTIAVACLYLITFFALSNVCDINLLIPHIVLAWCCIAITMRDFAIREIPDWASIGIAAIGIYSAAFAGFEIMLFNLFSGAFVVGVLWYIGSLIFKALGREGLGIGDAKLFGAATVLLGPASLPMLFLFASIGGIAAVAVARLGRQNERQDGVPFGPFIAYALFVLHQLPTFGV